MAEAMCLTFFGLLRELQKFVGTVKLNEQTCDFLVKENRVTVEQLKEAESRIEDMNKSLRFRDELLQRLLDMAKKSDDDCIDLKNKFDLVEKSLFFAKTSQEQAFNLNERVTLLEQEIQSSTKLMKPNLQSSPTDSSKTYDVNIADVQLPLRRPIQVANVSEENLCMEEMVEEAAVPNHEKKYKKMEARETDIFVSGIDSTCTETTKDEDVPDTILLMRESKGANEVCSKVNLPSFTQCSARNISFMDHEMTLERREEKVPVTGKVLDEGELNVDQECFQVEVSQPEDLDLFSSGSEDQDSDQEDDGTVNTINSNNAACEAKGRQQNVLEEKRNCPIIIDKKPSSPQTSDDAMAGEKLEVKRYLGLKNTDDPVTYEEKFKCKISFYVGRKVVLQGVGLYCKPNSGMKAVVQVFQNGKTTLQTPWVQVLGAGEIAQVTFRKPMILRPRQLYSITASLKGGSYCLGKDEKERLYHIDKKSGKKVFFKFIESGDDGQIPVIIFSHM